MVENIGGAGGGARRGAGVALAGPTATRCCSAARPPHITEALLKNKPTYDPLKDLEPISPIAVDRVRDRGASVSAG